MGADPTSAPKAVISGCRKRHQSQRKIRSQDIAGRQLHENQLSRSSSQTPEVAIRVAERLVQLEDIDALVCGVGEGQLEVLLPIADAGGIPFFNVGT